MKQIKIGTCIQGPRAEEWLPGFLGKGFETFSLNFHMSSGRDRSGTACRKDRKAAGRKTGAHQHDWILLQSDPVSGTQEDAGAGYQDSGKIRS